MNKRVISHIWLWAPVIIWMGLIFCCSSIKGQDMPSLNIANVDKLFHFVVYMVFGFLLAKALFRSSAKPSYKYIFIISAVMALLYGASDEFHQLFVSGRSCDVFDLIFDFVGGCAGSALSLYKESLPTGRQE